MLLSLRHAAERLDVHPDTLRRWINQGLVAGVRLPSGRWRVEVKELERLAPPDVKVSRIMEKLAWT